MEQTPASELNTMLMKLGLQPKYELTAEKICTDTLTDLHGNQYSNQYSNHHHHFAELNQQQQQQQYCPQQKVPLLSLPVRHAKEAVPAYGKSVSHPSFDPKAYPPPMPYHAPISSSGYMLPHQPYMFPAAPVAPFMRPSQPGYPFPSYRAPLLSSQYVHPHPPYHSNFEYSPNQAGYNAYPPVKQQPHPNKWNLFSQNYIPSHYQLHAQMPVPNKVSTTNFEAKVEFGGHQFNGHGRTVQAARHSAANEALKYVKSQVKSQPDQTKPKPPFSDKSGKRRPTSPTSSSAESEDPSPISLVFEIASRNHLKVLFEVIRESGQVHLPAFLMRCSLYIDDQKQPFMTAEGEGRSKKAAKRAAAKVMLAAMKEKQLQNSPPTQANVTRILSRPKKAASDKSPNEEIANGESADPSVNCKFGTHLYQITRNLGIANPSYTTSCVAEDDQLFTDFKCALADESAEKLYKVECSLKFEQRVPQHLSCTISTVGFAASSRVTKSISNYICLQKIGVQVAPFDSTSSCATKSLQFSLDRNVNLPFDSTNFSAEESQSETDDIVLNCTSSSSPEEQAMFACVEQNLQFILYLLGKVYLFTLKDKTIDRVFDKAEASLVAFYAAKYDQVSNPEVAAKCTLLKELTSQLNGNHFWAHLEFLSRLVSLQVDAAQLPTQKPLLQFKPHLIVSENSGSDPLYLMMITGHCSPFISRSFNFDLIKKNFVNFALGSNEEAARELASYWILKNLAYHARKLMIYSEFDKKSSGPEKLVLPFTGSTRKSKGSRNVPAASETSQGTATSRLSKSTSHSSKSQLATKPCITRFFDACYELNIRKPVFKCTECPTSSLITEDEQPMPLPPSLFRVSCDLVFIQELPEPISIHFPIRAIAPNARLGRTICAYLALSTFGVSPLEHFPELRDLLHFQAYLNLSLCNEPGRSICVLPETSPYGTTSQQQQLQENMDEVGRNLDFVVRLLQEIYSPFLKNHKMSCPSHLFERIEHALFEYHNHQQQILDQSETFDHCSARIEKCLAQLMGQFDGTQYWDHLRLLSSIASLLTADLEQPVAQAVLQFHCQISKSPQMPANDNAEQSGDCKDATETTTTTTSSDKLNSSLVVAIISLQSQNLPATKTKGLCKKSSLSFALGASEELARETASYRALRHLAINLWKSNDEYP